jgi:hypothetical protein
MKLIISAPILSLMLASTCSASDYLPHWQDTDYIRNSFVEIAHQNEHSDSQSLLRKWQKPIRYHIEDDTADKVLHKQLVQKQLAHLASITGLSLRASQQADLEIIFTRENKLDLLFEQKLRITDVAARKRFVKSSICIANFSVNADASINSAIVIIPVDRARAHGKLLSCVVEELTQVLGLPNDAVAVYPSIFNDHSYNDFLTGLDYILLKLLYSKQLKAGMTVDETQAVLTQLLEEPEFKLLINESERLVREDSLETLLQ